jgi:hypothetical protein
MYATAQRVRAADGRVGINTFLHEHGSQETAALEWAEPDIAVISRECPGRIVSETVEVAPGGNVVLSYLDVAAHDSVPVEEIGSALDRFTHSLADCSPLPCGKLLGRVAVEFGMVQAVEGVQAEEYEALEGNLLETIRSRPVPAWLSEDPLTVLVRLDEAGFAFFLDGEGATRVRAKHLGRWGPCRVLVNHETKCEFERIHRDMVRHVVPLLTDLRLEEVAAMGGVRFKDELTREQIGEWPSRQ